MTALATSAPGKAVLIGEYAVLEGAPAVVMAAGPRARVTRRSAAGPAHRVSSVNSGARAAFRAGPAGFEWVEGAAGDFGLVEHVWRAVAPEPAGSVELVLDTRDFFDAASGTKLGFGSSAALAVALAASLAGRGAGPEAVLRAALAAHREFQDGRGSGVDVAAAVHGGVTGYCLDRDRASGREIPQVEKLSWPAGLEACLLWSGRPAGTGVQLERLARAASTRALQVLAGTAEAAYGEWPRGAAAALAALSGWTDALLSFDRECDLGIFAAGHDVLYGEARRRGLVYKPCGAGGGDLGAAFARERAPLEAFAAWAAERGFRPLAAAPGAAGLTIAAEGA